MTLTKPIPEAKKELIQQIEAMTDDEFAEFIVYLAKNMEEDFE